MERKAHGFTIIELLVVVSIIALLIGILLPAIGKARDQAKLTQSQGNLRNLGAAHETYGSEWNDRQFTLIVDTISRYGNNPNDALENYHSSLGNQCQGGGDNRSACHPPVILGWDADGVDGNPALWGYWMTNSANFQLVQPIIFGQLGQGDAGGFGSFRLANCGQFNSYVTGRFYDPVFFAPKDTIVMNFIEPCWDDPGEFSAGCPDDGSNVSWTSYVMSPAAMFGTAVLGKNAFTDKYFTDPWKINGGFRSPSVGQCLFPNLKTRMLEHHWLQNNRGDCNPGFTGIYDGCQPYFFNHGWESVPVTLFYDGHIEGLGTREASQDNLRVLHQTGGATDGHGLWSIDTPFEGAYEDRSDGGYFMDDGYDWTSTSYHILTTNGIKGRDKLDK